MEQHFALTRGNQAPGVVKPEIGGNVNFEIKSQFKVELREDTFSGNKNDDAHEYVEIILDIVSLFNIPRVSHEAVMLRVFPITLTGAAKRWLEEIHNFKQESDETLYEAWERYNDLLYKCPTHDLNIHQKKCHDGSNSRKASNGSSNGIAAIANKLDSLRCDMKKLKENKGTSQYNLMEPACLVAQFCEDVEAIENVIEDEPYFFMKVVDNDLSVLTMFIKNLMSEPREGIIRTKVEEEEDWWFLEVDLQGCRRMVGAGGGEVKRGGVDFGVVKSLIGEIPEDVIVIDVGEDIKAIENEEEFHCRKRVIDWPSVQLSRCVEEERMGGSWRRKDFEMVDGTGRGEVKEGRVNFGVVKSLLGKIPEEVMGDSGGETFGVDGGAVWLNLVGKGLSLKFKIGFNGVAQCSPFCQFHLHNGTDL
ncbi:hypothetical protein Tco_1056385 [Tanacetum coccineum]|uniref:Retrotransposon gag domain-containing protein n=1 Tax=Tanacetum coccineum TaxID=301880 RepID=A0ABQ5H4P4_9ASTR